MDNYKIDNIDIVSENDDGRIFSINFKKVLAFYKNVC